MFSLLRHGVRRETGCFNHKSSYPLPNINVLGGCYMIFFFSLQLHGSYIKLCITHWKPPSLEKGEGGYNAVFFIDIMSRILIYWSLSISIQLVSNPPCHSGTTIIFKNNFSIVYWKCSVVFDELDVIKIFWISATWHQVMCDLAR